MKKSSWIIKIICLICLFLPSSAVFAETSGSYIYDESGYALPCPTPYFSKQVYKFYTLPTGDLDGPQGLCLDEKGNLVIADSGNARIIKMGPKGEVLQVIESEHFSNPTDVYVQKTDGDIYVADPRKKHVIQFDSSGNFIRLYESPPAETLPAKFIYEPNKLIVDKLGWLYLLGTGTSGGIIQMTPGGSFGGYFGTNPAPLNIIRRFLRIFMTAEQKRRTRLQVLLPTTNFDLDDNDFIYAVTESESTNQIKKFNPLGTNAYAPGFYGENIPVSENIVFVPRLSSITVNARGIVTALDTKTGKLFQYDADGNLLFIFGGTGDVPGTFLGPVDIAVDSRTDNLYVLDKQLNDIHVLEPSEFALLVYEASSLHALGKYQEAFDLWLQILYKDSNYPQAHRGLAKALEKLGRKFRNPEYLQAAMTSNRFANDKQGYSAAFLLNRQIFMREHMGVMILIVLGAIILLYLFFKLLVPLIRRQHRQFWEKRYGKVPVRYAAFLRETGTALSILRHPFRTMGEIKYGFSGMTVVVSVSLLVLVIVMRIITVLGTGFQFSTWDAERISLMTEIMRWALPWATWCVANWLVTLILDGEGKFGQIVAFSAYSLIPVILLSILLLILSYILSLSESGLYYGIQSIMFAWMAVLTILGIIVVHDFKPMKTAVVVVLSLIGLVLVWGVSVLLVGLSGSVVTFFIDLAREVIANVS